MSKVTHIYAHWVREKKKWTYVDGDSSVPEDSSAKHSPGYYLSWMGDHGYELISFNVVCTNPKGETLEGFMVLKKLSEQ